MTTIGILQIYIYWVTLVVFKKFLLTLIWEFRHLTNHLCQFCHDCASLLQFTSVTQYIWTNFVFLDHMGWVTIVFQIKPVISYVFVTKYQSCHFVLCEEGRDVNSAFLDLKWSISGGLGARRVKCQNRHQFYTYFPAFWGKIFFTMSKSFFASWRPPGEDYKFADLCEGSMLSLQGEQSDDLRPKGSSP